MSTTAQKNQAAKFAGSFYPKDPEILEKMIAEKIGDPDPYFPTKPKLIIMPHAGYRFSGDAAAKVARELAGDIQRVIVLSPSHRYAFRGIAIPKYGNFDTPLGALPVAMRALRQLGEQFDFINTLPEAFENEHGIEVTLPWIKARLPKAHIAPFVIGQASDDQIATLLREIQGDGRTLILVSTDLSHFYDLENCIRMDTNTAQNIETHRLEEIHREDACGWMGLRGALKFANQIGMRLTRTALTNSAVATHDKTRVVGYGGWVGHLDAQARLPDAERNKLYNLAAIGIQRQITKGQAPQIANYSHGHILQTQMASFVTLEIDGRLRGCIGSLRAHRPLVQDVFDNALKAAFSDRRFTPLTAEEFEKTDCEIAILSQPVELPFKDRMDLLSKLKPREHGLILVYSNHRATFLPKVWDDIPEPENFLAALLRKAQLPENFWHEDLQIQTYRTERFDKIRLKDAL